jgi:dynein heavy chain, axonemal
MLYKSVCRSLFEKDKLLFSFLMCLKIMDENSDLDPVEERFLMTGATSIELERPNPTGDNGWLSNKAWASILEVSKVLKAFKGFDTDFEKYINDWEKIYSSPIPHKKKTTWPGQWNDLSLFKRVIVMRLIRPDKVVAAIQKLIKNDKELGVKFI